MNEAKRILKNEGTVWINLGDSYFGSGNGYGVKPEHMNLNPLNAAPKTPNDDKRNNLPRKGLSLIPQRFAIGCIDRGWIVRNDIIWAKPNSLPESVTDRFAKKYEHIFFMVKNRDYYFDMDAIRDPYKHSSFDRVKYSMTAYGGDKNNTKGPFGKGAKNGATRKKISLNPLGKNPGDVTDFWTISTRPNSQNHYAAFNGTLITKPILAGCPKNGIVLDPFCGTGTTGITAIELGRNFIGIEGKKEYAKMANQNIQKALAKQDISMETLVRQLKNLSFSKVA